MSFKKTSNINTKWLRLFMLLSMRLLATEQDSRTILLKDSLIHYLKNAESMISRSNIVDGSKPYIVEDRPMISRSSGDRGECSPILSMD